MIYLTPIVLTLVKLGRTKVVRYIMGFFFTVSDTLCYNIQINKNIRRRNRMLKNKRSLICITVVVLALIVLGIVSYNVEMVPTPSTYASFWALVPPVIAIALALITKEVYSSLFIGILVGGVFAANFHFEKTMTTIFNDGIVAVLTDSYNVGILIFLVILGAMVSLMNKAGGSRAFGAWASEHIKSRVGAQLATILLGALIFIDDYFNCLTVGSVMKPVSDKFKVSRSKFAYLIDATAAPICIIAPISSWAAAVSGFVEGEDGLALFVRAIPYNFYAILTIVMMVGMVLMKFEFGSMEKHERNAKNGDIFSDVKIAAEAARKDAESENSKGKVIDLLIPIVSLIVLCVIFMIYTGGFFSGESFITAFSQSDASVGLALGSFFALVITVFLYVIRDVLDFRSCMECIPDGFKQMVPAILILTFAWSLKGMTDMLGAKEFVATVMQNVSGNFMNFLPAVVFLVGCFLAFATGTSWGTFGILIPIVVAVFQNSNYELMIISISACMAGAVCGDHCSPISDTTIMASAGAQCNHVNHVSTQLPYAVFAAAVSFVCYIVAGFVQSWIITLPIAIVVMIGMLLLMKNLKKETN